MGQQGKNRSAQKQKKDRVVVKGTSAFRGSQPSDTPTSRDSPRKGVAPKAQKKKGAVSNRPQPTVRMETPSQSVKKLPGHRDFESRKQRAEVQHHVSARLIVEKTKMKENALAYHKKWGGRFSRIGVSTPWQQRNQCWLMA